MKKLLLLAVLAAGTVAGSASVTHRVDFDTPEIQTRRMDVDGSPGEEIYHAVRMPDAPLAGHPGYPLIPHRPVSLLVPEGERLDGIDVSCGRWIRLEGGYVPAPSQPVYPLSLPGQIRRAVPNPVIYSSDVPYPSESHSPPKTFWCKGYQIVTFNLYPVKYIPARNEILYTDSMTVTLRTRTGARPDDAVLRRDLNADRRWVMRKVDNPLSISPPLPRRLSGNMDNRDQYDYVIVTTAAVAGMPGPNNFQDLLAFKATRGISGIIKTTEEIYSEYPGADNQTKIRNFCIDAYNNWNTQWILLGADHAGVPTRGCYATAEGHQDSAIPTDMYYGCLDGSWDYSGNGIYGEMGDGPEGGDPDVYAELFVGRASVDTQTQLHNFVSKTLLYETGDSQQEQADNALLLGEYLWTATYGGDYMDELWYGCDLWGYSTTGYPATWEIDHLYERESSWGSSDLRSKINAGTVFWLNHLGHASETSCMHFYNSDVDGLTNSRPILAYSQGCYAGAFDTTDCIAEHFSWADHAAFAVIMNGRYGWGEIGCTDGPSQYFHRQFHDAFFTEDIREIGRMNQDSKEDNVWCLDYKANRWVCYELNLLGCPQTPIHGLITTRGTCAFDRTAYGDGDSAMVTVRDVDLNTDPYTMQTVNVDLDVESGSDQESLQLLETGPNTCVFQGFLPAGASAYAPGNGQLDLQEMDVITVTYIDAGDGFGGFNVPVTDTAVADFTDPVITNVQITHIDDHQIRITWNTDEPSDSRVVYDTQTPPSAQEACLDELTKDHQVIIDGLEQCLDYYFYVMSTDDAGNSDIDDNSGSYHAATTMVRIFVLSEPMDTDPGWTITGGDWEWGHPSGLPSGPGHDPESGVDGPNVYGTNLNGAYQGGSAYHLITPPLDCSAAMGTRLRFNRWLAVDANEQDEASIAISTDGSNWTVIYENPASNFYEYRWAEVICDISPYADGKSEVYIRWTMGPAGTGSVGGWNIDNVEVSYPAPCNVPILIHHQHEIDDSAGNNNGFINPLEPIDMPVTLRNVGLDATAVSAVLTTDYPSILIETDTAGFVDIPQGGTGASLTPFHFHLTKTASDTDRISFTLNWTCSETSGSASFIEEAVAPLLVFDAVGVIDNTGSGDGDGIWDPGETVRLVPIIQNQGRQVAVNITGVVSTDQPGFVTLDDPDAEFPDIGPGGSGACIDPYFTLTSDPGTPDHTIIRITLDLDSDTHAVTLVFELDITTSTFARRCFWNLDTDPGWSTEGLWNYGVPAGNDGDPSSGYTGQNVYGYNLYGEYEDNLPETSLTSEPVDCTNFSSVEIRFMRWLGVESSQWDHASFRISADGSDWVTIWDHSGSSFTDPDWIPQSFDVSAVADGQETVFMRWVMGTTDGSVTYCGWNIDDVEIWADSSIPQPTATPVPPTSTSVPPTATLVPPTSTPVPPTSTSVPPTTTPVPPTATLVPPTSTPVPPTATPEPTLTPTPASSVTNSPAPPTATIPPPPTGTAQPTQSPMVTASASPTALPDRGMRLILEDTDLWPGEEFYLHYSVFNPEAEPFDCDVYVLLGVYGDYWCWPSWCEITRSLNFKRLHLDPGSMISEEILRFDWPAGTGDTPDLEFIGALFDMGSWDLIGDVQVIVWGFH